MKKVFRRTSLLLAAILMGSTSIQAQKSPQDMDRFIDALMTVSYTHLRAHET